MAQDQRRSDSQRVVRLTAKAENERLRIYLYTEELWGKVQADRYDEFLQAVLLELADKPAIAPFVPTEENTRSYVARWKNAREGHRIFFEEIDGGILVLHIIHTAQPWPAPPSGGGRRPEGVAPAGG